MCFNPGKRRILAFMHCDAQSAKKTVRQSKACHSRNCAHGTPCVHFCSISCRGAVTAASDRGKVSMPAFVSLKSSDDVVSDTDSGPQGRHIISLAQASGVSFRRLPITFRTDVRRRPYHRSPTRCRSLPPSRRPSTRSAGTPASHQVCIKHKGSPPGPSSSKQSLIALMPLDCLKHLASLVFVSSLHAIPSAAIRKCALSFKLSLPPPRS